MYLMLEKLNGNINIANDIIVYGHNNNIHDDNLMALFQRARKYGLLFNKQKYIISSSEIPFFGHIYSKSGTSPDPNRTASIGRIPQLRITPEYQNADTRCSMRIRNATTRYSP